MTYWAVTDLHLDRKTAVWEMPLPTLMLLVRENQRTINKNGMSLQDKDLIDELNQRGSEKNKRQKNG